MVRQKAKHKIMPTSLLAYAEVLENLGKKQAKVYEVIRKLGACNNKMIARTLGWKINSVTGRVKELREDHIVMQSKKAICPVTLKEEDKERLTIFWKVRPMFWESMK